MDGTPTMDGSGSTLRLRRCAVVVALCLSAAACDEPPPRTYVDFMEDRIAREGTLTRCRANPDAARRDLECANARRAESAIALREERERREKLEIESERKLEALRAEIRARDEAARAAEAAQAAALEAAYEAQWSSAEPGDVPGTPTVLSDAVSGQFEAGGGAPDAPVSSAAAASSPVIAQGSEAPAVGQQPTVAEGVEASRVESGSVAELEEATIPRPFRD